MESNREDSVSAGVRVSVSPTLEALQAELARCQRSRRRMRCGGAWSWQLRKERENERESDYPAQASAGDCVALAVCRCCSAVSAHPAREGDTVTTLLVPREFKTQAARDALRIYPEDITYAGYIETHTLELAERFPAERDYFMSRSLAEALQGNDGA